MHRPQDVSLRRLAHGVLLVVRQQHHVLARVAEVLVQIRRHVLDIVDTTTQLALLPEIVDSNQQGLALTSASRVLETVSLWSSVAERDRISGWWWWTTLMTVRVGVLILVHACVADVSGRILTLSKAECSSSCTKRDHIPGCLPPYTAFPVGGGGWPYPDGGCCIQSQPHLHFFFLFTVIFTDEDIHRNRCVEEARRNQAEGRAGHTRKDSEEDVAHGTLGRGNRRRRKIVGDDGSAFVFRTVSQRNLPTPVKDFERLLLVRLRRSVIRRIRVLLLLLLLLLLWWGVARWARIRRIVGHSWRANRNVHGARGRLGSKTEDVMKGKVR